MISLEPGVRLVSSLSSTMDFGKESLETWIGGYALQSFPGNGLQDNPWVMRQIPKFGIQSFPKLVRGVIEGPPQVQSQLGQAVRIRGLGPPRVWRGIGV